MLKELFLPEKIKSRRIRSERRVGIHRQDDELFIVVLYLTSSKNILEKVYRKKIQKQNQDDKQGFVTALQECFKEIKRYDSIAMTFPSSFGVYKEISVPFKQYDKIAMILEFELEPLLPFSVSQGISDFLITRQDETESRLFTVTIRTQDLAQELVSYTNAQRSPDGVLIDFFGLYGLYLLIKSYKDHAGGVVIIDIGEKNSRLAFVYDGSLRALRTIQQGISSLIMNSAQASGLSEDECRQKLLTIDLDMTASGAYEQAARDAIMKLLQEIQFSMDAFTVKHNYTQGFDLILFTEQSLKIQGLVAFCRDFLQINTVVFDCQLLISNNVLVNKSGVSTQELNEYAFSLGAVLHDDVLKEHSMRKKELAKDYSSLVMKTAIAMIFLLSIIFGMIITKGYFEIDDLARLARTTEDAEIRRLKKIIPAKKLPKKITLQNLVTQAEKIIKEGSNIWMPFSDTYIPPLEILSEITKLIDKRLFDVRLKELSLMFDKDRIQVLLEGHFKSLTGKDNYAYFGQFKKRFNESTLFELDGDVNERPEEDIGIPFTVKLKPRSL